MPGDSETTAVGLLTKAAYAGAIVGGCCFVGATLRHVQRVTAARKRLQDLVAAAAGNEARVVITGASSGIGKELAKQIHRHPSVSLLLGCRNVEQAKSTFKNDERTRIHQLDLLDPDSIQSFVDEAHSFLKGGEDGLRMLVNSAGVMKPPPAPKCLDPTWQTNFLGPFLLTELLARLRATDNSSKRPVRVVQVSSRLERRSELDDALLEAVGQGQVGSHAYSDSKRALMLWTSVRAQSLAFKGGLYCHASTPGMVDTELGRYSVAPWLWPFTKPLRMILLRSAAEGALSAAAAGLKPQALETFGRYFDGEKQLEDLVMERMGEKRLALDVVRWATSKTALEQRSAGYDR
eukprot:TRINITY_DN13798_c0_g1_i1.p1 TRINITY_DN13798_c0_g1~~TRINITY_DN13798_c0_g1_i1.p1  ORF type:complete len:349 (+),score=81.01 TRINITY_DN13798_c0_g1_i1:178-1224(+)